MWVPIKGLRVVNSFWCRTKNKKKHKLILAIWPFKSSHNGSTLKQRDKLRGFLGKTKVQEQKHQKRS